MLEFIKTKLKDGIDQKILRKEFKVGESVLLYNSKLRLFPRKLKSIWNGPYTIISITPFGAITLKENSGKEFKVNGQRLKHYIGGIMNEKHKWAIKFYRRSFSEKF